MNHLHPTSFRYTPQEISLVPDIESKVISDPLFLLGLGETYVNIINQPMIFQSSASVKDSAVEKEEVGTTPLGSNIANATDGGVTVAKPLYYKILNTLLRRPNRDGFAHDVKTFLEKPFLFRVGTLASTNNANTFGWDSVFEPMTQSNMFTSKLRGAYVVRATTHVVLQINANRMQQGRYLLAYMPTGGMKASSSNVDFMNYYKMHRYTKTEITQLMHVNLDISCDTQGELIIPYVSNSPGWVFSASVASNSNGIPGVFFMYPYVPLASASGSTSCSYSIYVYYTDVEIDGVGVAQGGKTKVTKRRDLLTAEAFSDRPISSVLNSLSSIGLTIGKIPLLSGVMGVASAVTDALANAAYVMGFSKPLLVSPPGRGHVETFPYLANADAHDASDMLALSLTNSVGIIEGFGNSDLDELSIDFLKVIPAWYATYNWTTANAVGDDMFVLAVSPDNVLGNSDTKNNLWSWGPLAYLARLFTFWRGSIVYTIKFTKTEFHSGRLVIRYIPYDNIAYAYPGVTTHNEPYCLKAIVDLRECNEFSFAVPFIYGKQWADCNPTYGVTGTLMCEVLDVLVAPATVPSTIQLSLEISGGKDFELASPSTGVAWTGSYNPVKDLCPTVPFILQGGTESGSSECAQGDVVLGNATISESNAINSVACHGAVYKTLRTLLKRGGFVRGWKMYDGWNQGRFSPRGIGANISVVVGTIQGSGCWDPYNIIAPLYSSVRGGMRLKGMCLYSGTTDHTAITTMYVRNYATGEPTSLLNLNSSTADTHFNNFANGACSFHQISKGGFSVQVPQQSRTPAFNVGDNICALTYNSSTGLRDPVEVGVLIVGEGGTGSSIPDTYFHRSVADDFNLAGFVSVPCTSSI